MLRTSHSACFIFRCYIFFPLRILFSFELPRNQEFLLQPYPESVSIFHQFGLSPNLPIFFNLFFVTHNSLLISCSLLILYFLSSVQSFILAARLPTRVQFYQQVYCLPTPQVLNYPKRVLHYLQLPLSLYLSPIL